jgi:hypothetical protein
MNANLCFINEYPIFKGNFHQLHCLTKYFWQSGSSEVYSPTLKLAAYTVWAWR